ncbi:MAG: hypothetical protein WCC53_11670 [Thermoanaerobaculia bacterium]|jgi:hypothetical protein
MKKPIFILAVTLAAATVAAIPGCSTNTRGDDAAPVFLVGAFSGDFVPNNSCVNTGGPLTVKTTTVTSRLKVPGAASTQFLDVHLDHYTVVWGRIDGGKATSPTESFDDVGGLVAPGGSSVCTDCAYMSSTNLQRPPLDQLFPFNGGIDKETGRQEIRQVANVTWYGHTLSGQAVTSDVASFEVAFQYCASAGRIVQKRAR